MNRKNQRRRKRKGLTLITLAVAMMLAGAAALVIPLLAQDMALSRDAEEYDALIAQVKLGDTASLAAESVSASNDDMTFASHTAQTSSEAPMLSTDTQEGRSNVDFVALYAENPNVIAWLHIPGTKIDYPVVQSDDVDYYLNHTFSGKKSHLGSLFSLGKTDYATPGKNIAIYGHLIRSSNDLMFKPLLRYKEQDFYAEHATIRLDTLYRTGTYRIFAVLNMRSGDWDPSAAAFSGDEGFLSFIRQAEALSMYDTGVEVGAPDEILTLITCDRTYGGASGRLVVMAVKE